MITFRHAIRQVSSVRVNEQSQRHLTDNTHHQQDTDIYIPAGFEPAISARELPQTHSLDRTVTGIGVYQGSSVINLTRWQEKQQNFFKWKIFLPPLCLAGAQLIIQTDTQQPVRLQTVPKGYEVGKEQRSKFVTNPWRRTWLVAESIPRTPGFVAVVGFVVNKLVLGQVFLGVCRFPVSPSVQWMLLIQINSPREW